MNTKSFIISSILFLIVVFSICFRLAKMPEENHSLALDEKANEFDEQTREGVGLDEPLLESEDESAIPRVPMAPEVREEDEEPEKPFPISGTVIEDGSGEPIPEFSIVVVHSDYDYKTNKGFPPVRERFKNENGLFSLAFDFGGDVRVHVNATGFYQEGWLDQPLSEDCACKSVIVKMKKCLCIKGRVVDEESGAPLAGVEIRHGYPGIRRRDAEGNISESVDLFKASTYSNELGEFEIDSLWDGLYIVTANYDEYVQQSVDVMAGSDDVVIRMNRGGPTCRIHGTTGSMISTRTK